MADKERQDRVKKILKAKLKRHDVDYRKLPKQPAEIGVNESEQNINNKISRGG